MAIGIRPLEIARLMRRRTVLGDAERPGRLPPKGGKYGPGAPKGS